MKTIVVAIILFSFAGCSPTEEQKDFILSAQEIKGTPLPITGFLRLPSDIVSVGKYLLVFDWNGTFIRSYKLDATVYSFCVDKTDKELYGFTLVEEEPVIIKFDLPI